MKTLKTLKNADMLIQVLLVFLFQKTFPFMIGKFMTTNSLHLTTGFTRHIYQNDQPNDLFTRTISYTAVPIWD